MDFTKGNILRADTDAIVNTVNCVGYMGRGIAAQFKRAYPENFKAYESACRRKEVVPGKMFIFETGQLTHPRFIVNFPTKRHWRGKSRIEDIESGLVDLVGEVKRRGIQSIAIPPLGCGLGGLDWKDVRPLIERAFAALPDVRALVFEPNDEGPSDKMATTREVPKMTPGRAVLVGLFEKYLAALMDPAISLLEVHKLMYFAQEAGEPLRLKYVKALYGPYAENLRHVLSAIEGYMISGYGDGGDTPEKPLELVPGADDDARSFLKDHPATLARFDRVSKLVEGFETSFGMELLATVHWVMAHEGVHDRGVVDAIHAWNPRKRMFTDEQILLAVKRLGDEGWLTGAKS
ncbi:Appr-1-p processing protein [Corallococcus interemptor]|uniref:Appr-1-p processing protein n=1 Tax=Corallococcus interemptor TaxID=2316720 RepID=A0A3A8QU00_9BACT|nr:macro domain-containing protein [Corallococcus interemptor]RKH71351.1 Appr-1-p processing protein [Corallococcus interemptor]